MSINNNPIPRIFLGYINIFSPILRIVFSMYPSLDIALDSDFHFDRSSRDGSSVFDKNQAQKIPKLMTSPYAIIWGIGEETIAKNAKMVVIDVRNIGNPKDSMVFLIAFFLSKDFLSSLKKWVTTCTPSEFAIVRSTMGIDVFIIVKLKIMFSVR